MAKAYKTPVIFIICYAVLYGFCIKAALSPSLPSTENCVILYSNQTRDNLRLVFKKCFSIATSSIDLWMYAATDALLLHQLEQRAAEGIQVTIRYDKRGGTSPLPPSLHPQVVKSKGLMHRKITIIDDQTVFIGSANMTTSSLEFHDNLTVGIYNPRLAQFLKSPSSNTFHFEQGDVWLLPDLQALSTILYKIEQARSSIFIAMFTFTKTDLIEALIRAHARGVHVKVAIDRYTAKGASKKSVEKLLHAGIPIYFSSGLPLLHHKWAYIDQQELILGSTNWTEAAFRKNKDILLFLHPLSASLKHRLNKIISAIELESNRSSDI